jgi:hypothetical protein
MTIELTIRAETTDELKEALARLLLANMQAVPIPAPPGDISTVRAAFNQVYDQTPSGDISTVRAAFNQVYDQTPPGGPKVQPPEVRELMREAQDKAREELVQKRAQAATQIPAQGAQAAATNPAPRKRGRPPTTAQAPVQGNGTEAAARSATEPGEDLSGDPEEGDHAHTPEEEPTDVLQPEAPTRTKAEMRNELLTPLRGVHAVDPKAAGVLCKRYKAPRISLIADEHTDALWNDVRDLCRQHGVPFVGEDVL